MGYIRITAGKFRLEDDNGNPAALGKVYTYLAGTSTAATTYSNKLLTVANTNPIILDERGECDLYTGVAIKLIATDKDDVVIWTEDYQGEQEEEFIVSGDATGDVNNNYVMDVVPAFTSIPANMTIVMDPSTTNLDTLASESVVGVTGINDLTWQGPYVGSTSGSIFSVQIDGTLFMGSGLNDLVFTGEVLGSVHTVTISTTGTPDKFKWRKDGGAWSAEISITGASQALDADVSIDFGATTGHTLNDVWNNKDTFRWKKDGGAWTSGVALYPRPNIPQTLEEGVGVLWAVQTGHTLNDVWALTVKTPAKLNFCSLGYKIIYKNVNGILKALDGGDIVADIPASLVYSATLDCFILLNPSLPILETLIPQRPRKELTATYTVTSADTGYELSSYGTFAINLPACPNAANTFYWFKRRGPIGGITTITANGTEKIYGPGDTVGASTFLLTDALDAIQLITNGVDWHVVAVALVPQIRFDEFTSTGAMTWTCPPGVLRVRVNKVGAGASGGGGDGTYGGGGGGAGGMDVYYKTVVPGTVYTGSVGVGGAAVGQNADGNNGGSSVFDAHITAGGNKGLKPGLGAGGVGGLGGNKSGEDGANGSGDGGGKGGVNRPAEVHGDYGRGGNGAGLAGNSVAGTKGYILIEY